MMINELLKGKPVKIKRGNAGKVTYQYKPKDEIPTGENPIARSVLTQPHLRQRAISGNKKAYNRKRMNRDYD